MPRLSKKKKQECEFFIDCVTGRRKYHETCRKCARSCKQSFRVKSIICDRYISKHCAKKVSQSYIQEG